MSKPAPKPNFLITLLWVIAIFMTVRMFTGNTDQNNQQKQTTAQLYQKLRYDNQYRLDATIVTDRRLYDSSLDEDVKAKRLTPAEREKKDVEAVILVADTQLKAGMHANETSRIRNAFNSLAGDQRRLLGRPEWNTPVAVAEPTKDFAWKEWSGQQLYNEVSSVLAQRNKAELVWGFIPGYQIIDGLVAMTGRSSGFSYAFAAFLLALLVRGIIFPLSQRQIMYGRQMSQLTPLVKEIKDRYKDDQVVANQKTMELYKEYGLNPLAGCAPMLVQMPFFFAIYQCMLHYQFTFEKGTFLWINEANSQNSHGFIAANLGQMDSILTIIYGISMIVSTLLTPVSDPSQVKQQRLMGVGMAVVWTFFMFTGAIPVVSGFVLYWTFTNMLATAQSLRAYRLPLPPLVKVNAKGGGVLPQAGAGGVGGKWGKWFEELQKQAEEQKKHMPDGGSNGKPSTNGKPSPNGTTFLGTGETKKGTPAKHKPKKRK